MSKTERELITEVLYDAAEDATEVILDALDAAGFVIMPKEEIERLHTICMDISDAINTDPRLFQDTVDVDDYEAVLRRIEDLAVSGYSHEEPKP